MTYRIGKSDRTGKRLSDDSKVTVVVREHPKLTKGTAKVLNVDLLELSELRYDSNTVRLEIMLPDGTKKLISCTIEEFEAFFGSGQLERAKLLRTRKPKRQPRGK